MKKAKIIGLTALFSLLMVATACNKKPSDHIHGTWALVDVKMPTEDSVTMAKMSNASVEYTFSKDGSYSYQINEKSGTGTFEINEEGTTLSTTEAGLQDKIDIKLSENSLELSQGTEKMIFEKKK